MSADARTRLLLIRHGESQVTVERVIGGQLSCTGLSSLGRRQAEALRDRFASGSEPPVDGLWASTLPRAVETAEIIATGLGDLPVQTDDDLVERRPGEADGVTYDDFPNRFTWRGDSDPYVPLAPGGESLADFHYRTGRALYGLVERHAGQTLAIACHGGVIDVAVRLFMGLGMEGQFDLWTVNTSITEFSRPVGSSRWLLARYNDAAHLAGLPARSTGE